MSCTKNHSSPSAPHPLSPLQKVELLHQNQDITSRMGVFINEIIHHQPIQDYIQCRSNWERETFWKVGWGAYGKAYRYIRRVRCISTCKLIHGLLHTRKEANKLYGTDRCPCYAEAVKTMNHVFSCTSSQPTQHRSVKLSNLHTTLEKHNTKKK